MTRVVTHDSTTQLDRRLMISRALQHRRDALVVTGLGNPTYDVAAAGDRPLNFYLWGAMGGAAMVGLGLARAQPSRRVLVYTGDGEMLMGLGALATIGVDRPKNLAILVADNEHYGETGMQRAHTGRGVDLAGVARASGFQEVHTMRTEADLERLPSTIFEADGPVFVVVKISTTRNEIALPSRDGPYLRSRFREALLGPQAHL